jgi:transposase
MAREFDAVDRGQLLLMPPSLGEWLPEDHLVWTVIGAVDQMDLARFRAAYRLGAAGRAPLDPAMLVALLLYSYARGTRSSRAIERACHEDVASKIICGMRCPDHSTVAEFRRRHQVEVEQLFDDVLGLCAEAGLVSVGVIAIDGTKIKASATMDQNRDYRQIASEILAEAEEIDRQEDELYGDRRGDELPEQLRTPEGRREALAEAKRRIQERNGRRAADETEELSSGAEIDPAGSVTHTGGRQEWVREGRRELARRRETERRPIPNDRADRLFEAVRRLEQNELVDVAAHRAYERWRHDARDTRGRRLGGPITRFQAPVLPDGQINLTDPDSRVMRTKGSPPHQSYNCQAAVNEQQVVLAAEVTIDPPDFAHLEPMLDRALDHLHGLGIDDRPEVVVADAGYWHTRQITALRARGFDVLVPPDGGTRDGARPGWTKEIYEQMRQTLATDTGRLLYGMRKITIEPVYGQIKYNRGITRFMRRGRAAVQSEWRLITASHNILKLHSHWTANTA